jgi:hypothetical protein
MAHVTLHFSLAAAAASLVLMPRLRRTWQAREPMSGLLGRWLLAAYALGVYASVPSLLRQAGLADAWCDGWWMNVFFFYPSIKRVFPVGGAPLGGAALGALFVLHYGTLLIAIAHAARARAQP